MRVDLAQDGLNGDALLAKSNMTELAECLEQKNGLSGAQTARNTNPR